MHLSGSTPHASQPPRADATVLPLWKRSIDLFCCFLALPFFFLTAAVLFVLLALTSPGPLLFKQERIGYKGRRFWLFKFRTMHLGADTGAHHAHVTNLLRENVPMNKMDATGDRRLIPFGWLIRAIGIDELPQVLNVLLGDMSIVGPRPCIPYEYEQYAPHHHGRLNSVPGLTGLWQVSGKNRTTFEEMVRLDIEYGHRKSLGLDLGIIARTLPALWTQLRDVRARRSAAPVKHSHPARPTTNPAPTFQT